MIRIIDCQGETAESFERSAGTSIPNVESLVATIISDVQSRGDKALADYTERLDGVALKSFKVKKSEIDDAVTHCGEKYIAILKEAAANISAYHKKQRRRGYRITKPDGTILGQRVIPLARVGIYVPGGTASYPSTVLMNALPAKIAGVKDIVMVTPPSREGTIKPEVLAAARVAGVTKIFKLGGAQAIAALAYGTKTVPAVDKIVGPGNIFVATAKKQVFGKVAIDMVAGPSDILIIADDSARPDYIAADMLSQAEHDRLSQSILICTSKELAQKAAHEIEIQCIKLARKDIASESIEKNGRIYVVRNLNEAAKLSDTIAPEHLELCVEDPESLLSKIRNAGSVFLGSYSPEPVGDYFAGPNHTLPTLSTSRFSSPLTVDDFIKKSSYIYYTKEALMRDADKIITFANSEGLTAHAASIAIRKENE
ncbi:MAG TPA: histidinol dehydrogenase [Bacillota bacterium]|nr:histidinol dehydrogenase [Bacillota bacterium]